MEKDFHLIPQETLLSHTETQTTSGETEETVAILVSIPANCDFFDGHFPTFKLLPAVAQCAIITHFSQKYFHIAYFVPHIKRIKFSLPILPQTCAHISLTYNRQKNSITFEIRDANVPQKSYSKGNFLVESKAIAEAPL